MQKLHLVNVSWDELLDTILDILFQDENKLGQNIEYYKKIYNSDNPDKVQIEKMYKRLTHEQRRLDYVRELTTRLQIFNVFAITSRLDNALKEESPKKGGKIENWIFTIRLENETLTTYFQPLANE